MPSLPRPVAVSDPFFKFTENDHRGLVATFAILSILVVVLTVGLQIYMRRRKGSKPFDRVDLILYFGVSLMLGYSACCIYSLKAGLGLPKTDDKVDVDVVHKMIYTNSIVGASTVFSAKLYMCFFIKSINDYDHMYVATRALTSLVIFAYISGTFATVFQCPLPEPWLARNTAQCVAAARIYQYNGVMNAATDGFLVILSIAMVWHVQLPNGKKKAVIIALFGLRMLCPTTLIPSLLSTRHLYTDNDFTWLAVEPVISQLVSYSLSIITACIPSLKYVFDSFGGFTLAIEAPYVLTDVAGKRGFHATAIDNNTGVDGLKTFGSGTLRGKNGDGGLKSGLRGGPFQWVAAEADPGINWLDGDGQSESVRDLTGGVMTNDVNTQGTGVAISSSPDGSIRSVIEDQVIAHEM